MYHEPVLKDEAIFYLLTKQDGVYIDGTLGGGGHTEAILSHLSDKSKVIACDLDKEALDFAQRRLEPFKQQINYFHGNFKDVSNLLRKLNITKVQGILLDLGVSSHQIDTPERGFSFDKSGRLDMRMDARQKLTAFEIINTYPETELHKILKTYGEEKKYRAVTREILKARKRTTIKTTQEFKDIISRVLAPQHRVKSLARVFQALRIAVNDELANLKATLEASIDLLADGGRVVVISYHSLEDRIVKLFFREEAKRCVCPPELPVCVCGKVGRLEVLTRRPLRATEAEIAKNPRSRSAKLRAAERI